jgi:hypothetical protein
MQANQQQPQKAQQQPQTATDPAFAPMDNPSPLTSELMTPQEQAQMEAMTRAVIQNLEGADFSRAQEMKANGTLLSEAQKVGAQAMKSYLANLKTGMPRDEAHNLALEMYRL